MKGRKRMKITKGGEDCVSSTLSTIMDGDLKEKTEKDALKVVDRFDPFAIPNLFRTLDRRRFGSVTEKIEALRSTTLKRLTPSPRMKPTRSIMSSDEGKTKKRNFLNLAEKQDAQPSHQNVKNKHVSPPVHPIDIDQLVGNQSTETCSDHSVSKPAQDVIHLEDDNAGNDDKEVTTIIIISESDDEVQMPSHQCHKAAEKSLSDVPSMNDLMVRGSAEKEVPKEEVGSAATEIDIGLNKGINLCDYYLGVRDPVERRAQKEEVSNKFDFGMDDSVDQVIGCSEKKTSKEEVKTIRNIEDRSAKNTYIETNENKMIIEDSNQIDHCDDLQVRGSAEKEVPKEELGSAATEIDIGLNKGINLRDYYLGFRDPVERKAQKEEVSNKFAFEMDESVDQVIGCPEKKTSEEEVKMVLNIEERSAKSTYIDTNEDMMIIEDSNRIDHFDYLQVRGSAEKEVPKEEVGSASTGIDIGVNKGINLYDYYLGVRDPLKRRAQKEEMSNRFTFGMDDSVDQVIGCPDKETSKEEVKMVLHIEDRSAKNRNIETNENRMIIEDSNRIDHCDYLQVWGNAEKEVPKEEVGSAATEIDIGLNKGINLRDYYLGVRDPVERKAQKEEVSNTFAFGMDEGVDQVIGCPEKKTSEEEVKMVPNIEERSAKNTYIDTNENMMIIEDKNWIDFADDMGRKPSEFHIEMNKSVDRVTGCSDGKALEEVVETVTNIDVRSAKNIYMHTDGNMMIKEDNDQNYIADDVGSQPSEMNKSIDHVAGCFKREASVEEVETVSSIDVRSAKTTYVNTEGSRIIKEDNDQIHIADDMGSQTDIAVMEKEYIDPNDDLVIEENNNQADTESDDDLANIWSEMAVALELSKDIAPVSITSEHSKDNEEECEHLSVHKDDLGDVCRICGIIVKGIETIFDFQYSKVKRTLRTYVSEPRDTSSRGLNSLPSGVNSLGDNSMPSELCVHPRHRKQMKPHQVEGFNFLCSNLLAKVPGGCILAHAPGSGKTFMIISFLQSFLTKCPEGRPLVVLPKGILATWKKEFKTWQVEDMALLDFYTSKAKNRSQQLDVLLQWEKQKSILFLGYQQFTAFFLDNRSRKVVADCQYKLLKVPSILILDEGHTPRNQETEILQCLAKVQTPRKVVLSGTLYQNHVEEVFTLLNLVRPKFLRLNTSRAVVSRIMSTVQVSGSRKAGTDSAFFNSVEYTLQKDENSLRKRAVIQNLREMTRNVLHYYKGEFLDELPGLVDFTVLLNLSEKQKEEVKKLKELDRFKQIAVGSALYVHPELKDFLERYPDAGNRNSSINIERIDEMLEKLDVRHGVKMKFFLNILGLCESTGEKLLVFSQYIPPLKLLERASVKTKGWTAGKEIFLITGKSSYEQRERSMQQFNSSPDARVFFGSIKACGEGVSLVGASRILILDVHLNPSVTRQAIGRAFRPGQKRKVYTYKLIAAGTSEEEDYLTCFRKEVISKMWFEWRESSEFQHFKMNTVNLDKCDDLFFESPLLQEDVKVLYRR